MDQADIDRRNAEFWNEPCGVQLAQAVGLTDHSPQALQRFDDAYFAMYPYLLPDIIRPERLAGKDVLEIGLGHGSVSQQIALAGARYTGLDIAARPVGIVNLRMQMLGCNGKALQGSALEMPFPDESFDLVIAIGCFHHTGNTERCFDETLRVLRPGGVVISMVYNRYSFRQWNSWPLFTCKELLRECGILRSRERATFAQRVCADANRAGEAAPETAFLSKRQLRKMLHRFEHVALRLRNADHIATPFGAWGAGKKRRFSIIARALGLNISNRNEVLIDRLRLLSTIGRWMGLDIYVEARKGASTTAGACGVAQVAPCLPLAA